MAICVLLNEADLEYDIHSLVQAFFPGREVLVRADRAKLSEDPELFICIDYLRREGKIEFAVYAGADGGKIPLVSRKEDPGQKAAGGAPDTDPASFDVPKPCGGMDLLMRSSVKADFKSRPETKNALKQKLYELLLSLTGRTLPWGTLTGIRPVRIALSLIEQGKSDEEICGYMKGKYLTSDEKITLGIKIAHREHELLKRLDAENGYSLYVGIPFCPTRCAYCSFTSFSIEKWADRVDDYLSSLEKEMAFAKEACSGRTLNSVYIGGGTPTSLSAGQLDVLIGNIEKYFSVHSKDCLEFTVEAGRPDSITKEKLKVLSQHGVTRISINPQTMNEETLLLIGRKHTPAKIKESFYLARDLGFDNINMDIIAGLPGEDIEDVSRTLDELAALKPDSVTVHSLAVKRAARLRTSREDFESYDMKNSEETMELAEMRCADMGLYPYYLYRQKNMAGNMENVGYAREGREGIYNILIMEEKQSIIALGAGAVSKLVLDKGARMERTANVKDIQNYLDRTDEMIERKQKKMEEEGWLLRKNL